MIVVQLGYADDSHTVAIVNLRTDLSRSQQPSDYYVLSANARCMVKGYPRGSRRLGQWDLMRSALKGLLDQGGAQKEDAFELDGKLSITAHLWPKGNFTKSMLIGHGSVHPENSGHRLIMMKNASHGARSPGVWREGWSQSVTGSAIEITYSALDTVLGKRAVYPNDVASSYNGDIVTALRLGGIKDL